MKSFEWVFRLLQKYLELVAALHASLLINSDRRDSFIKPHAPRGGWPEKLQPPGSVHMHRPSSEMASGQLF